MRSPVSFEPEQLAAMGRAYDTAVRWLDAHMSTPPEHEDVARIVVRLAARGLTQEVELASAAIQWFYLPLIVMTDASLERA